MFLSSLLKSEMCMMQLHRGKMRNTFTTVQTDEHARTSIQQKRKGNSTLIMSVNVLFFTFSFLFLFLGILTNYARLVFSFHFVLLLPFSFQLPSHFTTQFNCAGIKIININEPQSV